MTPASPLATSWLQNRGFRGFASLSVLADAGLGRVPDCPGVYAVLREAAGPPEFLAQNPGGRFKGRDPTKPVEFLRDRWCAGSHILYVGKAGTSPGSSNLRKRVAAYLAFGDGKPVGHWGGRLIWQVKGAQALLLAWRTTPAADARKVEAALLQEIMDHAGRLPFANLRR